MQRYNADLANGLGNLASRTLTMITRYFKGEVPYPSRRRLASGRKRDRRNGAARRSRTSTALFEQCQFSRALEVAWGLVAAVDKYIVENQPWALGEKQDDESRSRLATILYTSAEALRIVTALAHPIIPEATAKIWAQLGLGDIRKFALSDLKWGQLQLGTKLGDVQPVFPRADKSAIERMQQMEEQGRSASAAVAMPEKKHSGDAGAAATGGLRPHAKAPTACPTARSALTTSPRSNCAWAR